MQGIFEISIPEKYVISIPDMEGNETNADFTPMLDKYCNNILKRGWKVWNGGPMLHAEIHSLVVQEFLLILGFGGSIKYYNPYVKVEKTAINDEIPEGLSNRSYIVIIDDSGPENIITEERIHTWTSWRSPNHPITEKEDGFYFISATYGQTLSSQELFLIYSAVDVTLVDEIPEE